METKTNYKVEFLDSPEMSGQQREAEVQEIKLAEDVPEVKIEQPEFKDEDVFGYLGKKLNKTITSYDDLFVEKVIEKESELPEDVNAFYKFKKDTGRGLDDFVKLNKDYDKEDTNTLLAEYYQLTNEELDSNDIKTMLKEFDFDEDIDEEGEIEKKKLALKKATNEAKKYFNQQKENYKVPLASSMASLSEEDKVEFDSFKQYKESAKNDNELIKKKSQVFAEKTNNLLKEGFKGFEFKINENKTLTFSPADVLELKQANSTPMNLIGKFLDENGIIKDEVGYHKALAMANYPDRVAAFFYEQGKADATESVIKDQKNINMTERKAIDLIPKAGMKVEFLNDNSPAFKINLKNHTRT